MPGEATFNSTPNPGSREAVERGCSCPVIDNCYGRGYYGRAGEFVFTCGCPLHFPLPDRAALDAEVAAGRRALAEAARDE